MLYKIICIVCILFNVYHESKSDYTSLLQLNADVRFIGTRKEQSVTFTCISLVRPLLCGVEFLLNYRTLDNLRLTEYGCYHGGGKCSPALCNCSDDCSTFQLNYTDAIIPNNFTFGCSARFDEWMKVPLRAEVVKFYNATGLYTIRTTYIKSNTSNSILPSSKNTSEETSTILNPSHTNNKNCAIWTVLLLIESIILIGSSVVLLLCKLREKINRNVWIASRRKGQPLMSDADDSLLKDQCSVCTMKTVCVVCLDCRRMFCEPCCQAHNDIYHDHKVWQIEHCITAYENVKCDCCKMKLASAFCFLCKTLFCESCSLADDKVHEHKLKTVVHAHNPMQIKQVKTDYKAKFKYQISTSNLSQSRICGVTFLDKDRIIVADFNENLLMVFNKTEIAIIYELEKEPKGMVKLSNNRVAVTFPYEKELVIYDVGAGKIAEHKTIKLGDFGKPFSIAFSRNHFAIETGEGDDGKIIIIDQEGKPEHEIKNKNDLAHFTSNTIRLALDYVNKKVFIVAVSKKEVLCVDFTGHICWKKSLASPRGIVFVKDAKTDKNIIVACKRWNLIYNVDSNDGRTGIIMGEGNIVGPRYIDYNLDKKLICVQIDNGDVLVYNYDIKQKP